MKGNEKMKVGFTGTRRGMTSGQRAALRALLQLWSDDLESFHHGGCVGADAQAHALAGQAVGLERVVKHPPVDSSKMARCEGGVALEPKPYLVRNQEIVDVVDCLVAAPKTSVEVRRSGTWATVRMARKRLVRVVLLHPDGSIEE